MFKNNARNTQARIESTTNYFNLTGILDNLKRIAEHLMPWEVVALEEALGKSLHTQYSPYPWYANTMYKTLYNRYFPNSIKTKGMTSKEAFKDAVTQILTILKKQTYVDLSPYALFTAISGKTESLFQDTSCHTFDSREKHWLQAIQYGYHLKTDSLPESIEDAIQYVHTAAVFFSLKKDYTRLEILFQEHQTLLKQQYFLEKIFEHHRELFWQGNTLSPFEIFFLFYAYHGHFKKIEPFLLHLSLEKYQISIKVCTSILIQTAKYGALETMQCLLEHYSGQTLSHWSKGQIFCSATRNGALDIMKFLLTHAAWKTLSIDYQGEALYLAAHYGHLKIVQFLITHSNGQITADHKGRALCSAARSGYLEIVSFLLTHPNQQAIPAALTGWAFHTATAYGHLEVVKLLIELPLLQAISKKDKKLGFLISLGNGYLDIVEFLFNRLQPKFSEQDKEIELLIATRNGHVAIVKFILRCLTGPISVQYKEKALETAKKNGASEIESILIDYFIKQDITQTTKEWTPLKTAKKANQGLTYTLLLPTEHQEKVTGSITHCYR